MTRRKRTTQCRAEEQGYVIRRGRERILRTRQCARRTSNENGCCFQHQDWAEQHPTAVASPADRVLQH